MCKRAESVEFPANGETLQPGTLPPPLWRTHPCTNSLHWCVRVWHTHRWLNSGCLPVLGSPSLRFSSRLSSPSMLNISFLLNPAHPTVLGFFSHNASLLFGLQSSASAKWPERFRCIHECNHVALIIHRLHQASSLCGMYLLEGSKMSLPDSWSRRDKRR